MHHYVDRTGHWSPKSQFPNKDRSTSTQGVKGQEDDITQDAEILWDAMHIKIHFLLPVITSFVKYSLGWPKTLADSRTCGRDIYRKHLPEGFLLALWDGAQKGVIQQVPHSPHTHTPTVPWEA